MEYFTLNNGIKVPAVGLGTYNPANIDFSEVTKKAAAVGYTFFDTASLYGTEKAVGKGLAECGLKREEYQVQSKFWIDEMGYKNVLEAFDRTMERLNCGYLDIYMMHWPRNYEIYTEVPGHGEVVQNVLAYDKSLEWKELMFESYCALEELYDKKLIKGIGLANFLPQHLIPLLEKCRIKPVVNQIEMHIGYDQPVAAEFAAKQGIVCQAWSPFARGGLFKDGFIKTLAEKYGVTPAQIALRYLYQKGVVSLPKASSTERLKENLDIFSFTLSEEDYYILACMVPAYWCLEHPDFRIPGYVTEKIV